MNSSLRQQAPPVNYPLNAAESDDEFWDNYWERYQNYDRFSRITNPSEVVWVLEHDRNRHPKQRTFATWTNYSPHGNDHMYHGHGGGSNVLFLDGHISKVTPDSPVVHESRSVWESHWIPIRN